jgi:WhiB family redox-sensing transcriptional regulator
MAQQQPRYAKVPALVRPDENDATWRDKAACRDRDPDLFFGLDGERAADKTKREKIAAELCNAECPVMFACRAWAVQSGQDAGVWGGLGEEERLAAKRRAARQRPKTQAPA